MDLIFVEKTKGKEKINFQFYLAPFYENEGKFLGQEVMKVGI